MRPRLAVGGGIAAIALFGFFVFPGHTYLQSDTQIYIPMLEHLWDPSTYPGDLVAAKPHLSYTIYDEVALGLRWLLGMPFAATLIAQQLLFRVLQIAGVYMLARAFPLSRAAAVGVAAIAGLGATIGGPSVLLLEYEPVPRGFAIGFVFAAVGLAARNRFVFASALASAGLLYHAPTTAPFWICFLPLIVWRREWKALLPLSAALGVLLAAAHFQAGVTERQHFLFSIPPDLEQLQRMRASYNWVSIWAAGRIGHYLLLWIASVVAYWRVRPQTGVAFILVLPVLGLLSVPASFLFLEILKWGLIPQFQPARTLLFVTAFALILSAAAGFRAIGARRWLEAGLWLALALWIPFQGYNKPGLIEDADLASLENFARQGTPKSAMFAFPAADKALYPGVFRARALRSVFVDWKAGGQVNYYRSLAADWWDRWERNQAREYRPGDHMDFLVFKKPEARPGEKPVYENNTYAVYRFR